MPLDPLEDMYESFKIEVEERDGNCLTLCVSALHFLGDNFHIDNWYIFMEMLDSYMNECPAPIAQGITAEMLRANSISEIAAEHYKKYKQNHPKVSYFINWYTAARGDRTLIDVATYRTLRNSKPKIKIRNNIDYYNLGMIEQNNEILYYYETYERIDTADKIAQYYIYSWEVLEKRKDKTTNKFFTRIQFYLADELLFLVESWQKGVSWKTSRNAYE